MSAAADPRQKRALSHVGGPITIEGEPAHAERLAHALDVPLGEGAEEAHRAHVHGFHTYPARMHPVTASRLITAFSPEPPPRAAVLDPFCGSGTVLVEARLTGRDAVGTDLNPLAVHLARMKTHPFGDDELLALGAAAERAAAFAEERREARAGATRRLPDEDVATFEPHVLLALDGLRAGIEREPPDPPRRIGPRATLLLVLSAILTKLSRRRSDTSEAEAPRRIAADYPARLFVKKTSELVARLREVRRLAGDGPTRVHVEQDDATELRRVRNASIDLVVTSPPYVATYDYLAHHSLRLRWLGLDARALDQRELGARRRYRDLTAEEARRAWTEALGRVFAALARVTKPGAPVVLLMADSAVRGAALRAPDIVADAARGTALRPTARASQARPHFHGPTAAAFEAAPREEHALLLLHTARGAHRPRG